MKMPLAIFDLDNTLIEGDCEKIWSTLLTENGFGDIEFSRKIDGFFQDYDAGTMDIFAYQSFLHTPISRMTSITLDELKQEFLSQVRLLIRPEMIVRVNWHRLQNHKTLLISASNSFLVESVALMLNFADYICTTIEMCRNKPTGRILGIPAFREGKYLNLANWLTENNLTLEDSWGYSDSINDTHLLEKVTHPVAVTPDLPFRKYAQSKGWRIMDL